MACHRSILTQHQTRKIEIGKNCSPEPKKLFTLFTYRPRFRTENLHLCSSLVLHGGNGISTRAHSRFAGTGISPTFRIWLSPGKCTNPIQKSVDQKCYHLALRRSDMAIEGPETENIWPPKCTSANGQAEVASAGPNMVPACKTLSSSTHDPPK